MSESTAPGGDSSGPPGRRLPLALGALGVVFGDIGTSPLYSMTECFTRGPDGLPTSHALDVTQASVLGVLSLIFWALTLVVTLKYLTFVTRANNKGEGGMFALLALVPGRDKGRVVTTVVVLAGLLGASLLFGEGVITPAISVLSAVEGLEVATHALSGVVVPLTLLILLGLFLVQRRGTGPIARVFGPVMVLWFLTLAALGLRAIAAHPTVLAAINPLYGVRLFEVDPVRSFKVLGAVVLCLTGAEALYADMGHFGRAPIRQGWLAFAFPALLLNYFGQGAALLDSGWVARPFWAIVPGPLLYPVVVLATAATVIASQALITGSYSLAHQAVQLGFLPRLTIVHTSARAAGQIYLPEVNRALMVACLALVLGFRSSSSLAAAYGIAVTGTMTITTLVFTWVALQRWKWPWYQALPLMLLFLAIDVPFFLSNTLKFFSGGWVPIALGVGMFTLMTTWKRGRYELSRRFLSEVMPLDQLLKDVEAHPMPRVKGTAVFMSGNPDGTPPVLLHHLKHNQVLHQQVILLSIISLDQPWAAEEERLTVKRYEHGFFRIIWQSGFMETPNVPSILKQARRLGVECEPSATSYFLGRETLLTAGRSNMFHWRKALFAFVSRNALPATSYFGIPPGRVVELGMQVDL